MKNMSLKIKLNILVGILISFIILSAFIAIVKMNLIGNKIVVISEQYIPLLQTVTKVTVHQLEQAINFERALRLGAEITENEDSKLRFNHAVKEFNKHSRIVNKAVMQSNVLAKKSVLAAQNIKNKNKFQHVEKLLENIKKQHNVYEVHAHMVFSEITKGNVNNIHQLIEKIEIEEDSLDHRLELLLVELEMHTKEASLEAKNVEQEALVLIVVITMLAVIIGSGLAFFLIRNLMSNIHEAVTVAETIASGDLTQDIKVTANDEMGLLLSSLATMQKNLHKMINEMNDSSAQLASAAEELSVVSEETSTNINNEQSEVEQAATAINEMSMTIQEVARNASSTSDAAQSTNTATIEGLNVVKLTVSSINQLSTDIEGASTVIHELESDIENIGGVLDVIKNIAEQTNLLALNAAIEAARAGEQGRGFAVVADEVRTLASRTQESTHEIESMITKLQGGSKQAVNAMEASSKQAMVSVEQANAAGTALQTITESVALISDMSIQIATAAEEQSSVAEEINKNITSVRDLGAQTLNGANQTTATSQELASLAVRLQTLITEFKV